MDKVLAMDTVDSAGNAHYEDNIYTCLGSIITSAHYSDHPRMLCLFIEACQQNGNLSNEGVKGDVCEYSGSYA